MIFGWLGRGFARLGSLIGGPQVPATALLTESSVALFTEDGITLLTE